MNKRLEQIRFEQILLHGEFYEIGRELALLPYVTTSSYKQSYNRR